MANQLGLDYDEVVILKETDVAHGGVMSNYTDELILTNKKIICISKGAFGGTKKIYHYPLNQIKMYNGVPQAKQGKLSNGTPSLDIYFLDGDEHFNFSSRNKQTIVLWINEICKLFGVSQETTTDASTNTNNDSVFGAFKEVGESFKDIGRGLAGSFGFRVKEKQKNANNRVPDQKGKNDSVQSSAISRNGETDNTIVCSSCGKAINKGSKFCSSCGAPIMPLTEEKPKNRVCPNCGNVVPPDLKFCTECGTLVGISNDNTVSEQETTPQKGNLTIEQQIELLQKLKLLVDTGAISQEEFEKKKKEIF